MGFLDIATPLTWESSMEHLKHVRHHGVLQFVRTLRQHENMSPRELVFGDEIEYTLVRFDQDKHRAQASLSSTEYLEALKDDDSGTWHPEYASYMIESTPAAPYTGVAALATVQADMEARRRAISAAGSAAVLTLTAFPTLGTPNSLTLDSDQPQTGGEYGDSAYVPDRVTHPHPRFLTMTKNIRTRRQGKVDIRAPLFQDKMTKGAEVHMDHQAFGMGMSCLQVTMQSETLTSARRSYDQMAAVAPVLLALTAATPVLKGRLVDTDARWNYIGASVDDRTPAERGEVGGSATEDRMVGGGVKELPKSRYATISSYISEMDGSHDDPTALNDTELVMAPEALEVLRAHDVDESMARHVAHYFARDPLVMFEERLDLDDDVDMDHWESLNSMNWQTVRFKPPPAGSDIGWRVEVRPCEVQPTDLENAAFTAFIVLLTKAAERADRVDWRVKISQLDENMERAHARDAVNTQRFFWPSGNPGAAATEQSLDQIVNGPGGLVDVARRELYAASDVPVEARQRIEGYLALVSGRASGALETPAVWMRRAVVQHPQYAGDSVVSHAIAFDLMQAVSKLGAGNDGEAVEQEVCASKAAQQVATTAGRQMHAGASLPAMVSSRSIAAC